MQGANVNDSTPWARAIAYPAADGRSDLAIMGNRLTASEQVLRQAVIQQARTYIDRCAAAGGVTGPISRTFHVRGDKHQRRVDIEVILGEAFVP